VAPAPAPGPGGCPGSPAAAGRPEHDPDAVVPVFFLSDSTGTRAETMGNALLIQFPDVHVERTLIPFISGLREARRLHGVGDVRRYDDRMAAIDTWLHLAATSRPA